MKKKFLTKNFILSWNYIETAFVSIILEITQLISFYFFVHIEKSEREKIRILHLKSLIKNKIYSKVTNLQNLRSLWNFYYTIRAGLYNKGMSLQQPLIIFSLTEIIWNHLSTKYVVKKFQLKMRNGTYFFFCANFHENCIHKIYLFIRNVNIKKLIVTLNN